MCERSGITLHPIVPNPLTGSATVSFSVPELMQVSLMVYNLSARVVSFVGDEYPEGDHSAEVSGLAPGACFVRMVLGNFTATTACCDVVA